MYILLALAWLVVGQGAARAYDWLQPTNKVGLMVFYAHSDDEGEWFGGALPYYSTVLKVPTVLVYMTGGWDATRDSEMLAAAWTYGVRYQPIIGHFQDIHSDNITNGPYPNTIDMTWDCWADNIVQGDGKDVEAGKTKTINFVAEQIRRYRPDVILTHDLNGESGHDNHKATAYAVTRAYYVAADPNATATNLVGLAPWQAQKLYVHLYSTNRLFHRYWETPYAALTNLTPRQAAEVALRCDVSQGPSRWIVQSVYSTQVGYNRFPSEWWGLYASTVGPDTVLSASTLVNGYTVPAGVAAGSFLQHSSLSSFYESPAFTAPLLTLPAAATGDSYAGPTLADYVIADPALQTLTFSKVSGPAWLNVAADGSLSGVSSSADAGTNTWVVAVTDGHGLPKQAMVTLFLAARPPGEENLVGWWRLNESNPASPTAANSAPLSPDGVCYGGVAFGQNGAGPWTRTAALFDGSSGKIDVPYAAKLNPAVFTAALWAKVTGGSGTYRSPLTSRKAMPMAGYMFYAADNNLWQFRFGNGSAWTVLNAGPVTSGAWIHLAATYDGATARFYTNGILAASASAGFQPNDAFPLRIGAGATEGSGTYWFTGLVDDVRIYRAALDPLQVRALSVQPPSVASLTVLPDGTVRVQGAGLAGSTYVLLAGNGRPFGAAWMPVATNVSDQNGQVLFVDPAPGSSTLRFYRLIMP